MDVPYMEVVGFESKWIYKITRFLQFVDSNSEGKISHAPLCLIQLKKRSAFQIMMKWSKNIGC